MAWKLFKHLSSPHDHMTLTPIINSYKNRKKLEIGIKNRNILKIGIKV